RLVPLGQLGQELVGDIAASPRLMPAMPRKATSSGARSASARSAHPTAWSGAVWGTMRFDGRDVTGLSEDELAAVRNQVVGFVFQSFQLLPRTAAVGNVGPPLGCVGL